MLLRGRTLLCGVSSVSHAHTNPTMCGVLRKNNLLNISTHQRMKYTSIRLYSTEHINGDKKNGQVIVITSGKGIALSIYIHLVPNE